MMKVLSLFDGISVGRLALERAGVRVDHYYASEIDKYAEQISASNWSDIDRLGSVCDWPMWKEFRGLRDIDLIIAGSPCQGFSFQGKELAFDDPRSKLFFDFVACINEFNPKYFLLENVYMKKEYQDIITGILGVKPVKINSNLVSAQNRRRIYWCNWNVSQPEDKNITISDIIEHRDDHEYIPYETIQKIAKWKAQQKPLESIKRMDQTGKIPCLTARGFNQMHSGMCLIRDDERYRYLTVTEGERAQTLPDGYCSCVNPKDAARALGNGWTCDVIAHIFRCNKEMCNG